jgi:hypothetical protein
MLTDGQTDGMSYFIMRSAGLRTRLKVYRGNVFNVERKEIKKLILSDHFNSFSDYNFENH